MAHNSLQNYYQTIFNMVQHYHYSIMDLENIYPFELDLYTSMLQAHLRSLEHQNG